MKTEMIPLLLKALDWAKAEHEAEKRGERRSDWRQEIVHIPATDTEHGCGSAYCIGGWIVSTHYGVENPYDVPPEERPPHLVWGGALGMAEHLLGLTSQEADDLFAGDNDINTLCNLVADITGENV